MKMNNNCIDISIETTKTYKNSKQYNKITKILTCIKIKPENI